MRIPDISDERLAALMAKIKPVKTVQHRMSSLEGGAVLEKLHWLKLSSKLDPREDSFTWNADTGIEAFGLKKMKDKEFTILVSWGYYGFFKPSLVEVFSQMPKDLEDKMVAFEIHGPETRKDMFGDKWSYRILNEGFQLAIITPYEEQR